MRKYDKRLFKILRNNRKMDIKSVAEAVGLSTQKLMNYEEDFGKTPAHIAVKLMLFYENTLHAFSVS